MENPDNIPKGSLDVRRCFNEAIEVFKKNALVLALATFLLQAISLFTLFILAGVLSGGYYWMLLLAMRREDRKVSIGDMFQLFNKFLPLLGLFFIEIVLVAAGFFVFFIPGVLLATMWLYAFFFMVDKNEGVYAAFKSSWNLVLRKGFVINLLLCIIYLAITGGSGWIPYVGWIAGLFLIPLASLMITSAYMQQVEEG